MSQTVLITGTGRPYALGLNLVRRYLFETKRHDKDGPVFITYAGEAYPW